MNTIQLLLEMTFMIVLKMCSSFKHFVQGVDGTHFDYKDVKFACLTCYKSVDDKEWVCKTCVGALLSRNILACSAANGFKFQEISYLYIGKVDSER